MKVRALVLEGFGINCEREMAIAWRQAGADAHCIHVSDILNDSISLEEYGVITFPGGFTFGDDLGAGKALANRFLEGGDLSCVSKIQGFVDKGGCVLGICNGFQLLVKMGLLPGGEGFQQNIALATNNSNQFEDRWVWHRINGSSSVFTRGLEKLYLPVRHAEGRVVAAGEETIQRLFDDNLVAMQYGREQKAGYPENPNGSIQDIAGLTDKTGRILGMMAHPEAAASPLQHPRWTRGEGTADGLAMFVNAVKYMEEKQCSMV